MSTPQKPESQTPEEIAREILAGQVWEPRCPNPKVPWSILSDRIAAAIRSEREKCEAQNESLQKELAICRAGAYRELDSLRAELEQAKEWKESALEAMHENEEWRTKFNAAIIDYSPKYAGWHYLKSAVDALKELRAQVEQLKQQLLEQLFFCSECGGSVVYKRHEDRIILFHTCVPKGVREAYKELEEQVEQLKADNR